VQELVGRGHRVSYATGEKFADVVTSAGATYVPTSSTMPSASMPIDDFGVEVVAQVMNHLAVDARANAPMLLSRFQEDRPDAVCYDSMSVIGRILAANLGLPDIMLVPNLAFNDSFSLLNESATPSFDHPAVREAVRSMRWLAAEFDLAAHAGHPFLNPPASLNIVCIPREFQIAGDTFDERYRFVGPSVDARGHGDDWRPPANGSPLVFVSLGTMFNDHPDFFRMCVEAFADSSWNVAMAIGEQTDPAALGDIPRNVEVRAYFPQVSVLEHAAAFVSHAGMGSTMESLYFGVPLVAVPQIPEQEMNASRAEELGLGRVLDAATVTAEQLRATVDDASGDALIRANLEAMRDRVRGAGGAVAAADAIEAHLA
jgi:MGT family glycosyltransferase